MTDEQIGLRVDDLLIDEETGEVLEWPPGWSADRLAVLIENHEFADRQMKQWDKTKRAYKLALSRMLDELGVKSTSADTGRATWVADGVTSRSPAANVRKAVNLELLTDEQATELLIEAAKELDPKLVAQWVNDQVAKFPDASMESWAARALTVLIDESPRSGYVRVTPAARPAPTIEREVVEPFDD